MGEEVLRQQVEQLTLSLRTLEEANRLYREREEQMLGRPEAGPKRNLGLQSMVPQWSGESGDVSVEKFIQTIEDVAESGNWSEKDRLLVCRTKVLGAAAACLEAHPELREREATWEMYKKVFRERFRDVAKPEHYLLKLHSLRQERDESVRAFATRCRALGEQALSHEGSAEEKKGARTQLEKGVLAAYLRGLTGEIGKLLRYSPPATLDTAVERATIMEREEMEQRAARPPTDPRRDILATDVSETHTDPPCQWDGCPHTVGRVDRYEPQPVGCFRCGLPGHFARECGPALARGRSREGGRCFRCGRAGHFVRQCTRPGRGEPARDNSYRAQGGANQAPKDQGPA